MHPPTALGQAPAPPGRAPANGGGRPAWALGLGLALLLAVHAVVFTLASPQFQVRSAGPDPKTFLSGISAPAGFQQAMSSPLDRDLLEEFGLGAYGDLVRAGHIAAWIDPGDRTVSVLVIRTGSSLSASSAESYLVLDLVGVRSKNITTPVDGVRAENDLDPDHVTATAWSVADVVFVVLGAGSVASDDLTTEMIETIERVDRAARTAGFEAPFLESPGYIVGRLVAWAWFLVGLLFAGRFLVRLIRNRGTPRGDATGAAVDATAEARRLRRVGRTVAAVQAGALVAVMEAFLVSMLWGTRVDLGLPIPPIAVFMVLPLVVVLVAGLATLLFRFAEGRRSRQRRSASGQLVALGPALAGVVALGLGLLGVSGLGAIDALGAEFLHRVPDRVGEAPGVISVVLLFSAFVCLGLTLTGAALAFRWARLLQVRAARRTAAGLPGEDALLLRSFRDDRARVPAMAGGRRSLLDAWSLRGSDRFEEIIAWELSDRWPVVAVAEPGGATRALGAARVSLSDDRWRDAVWRQMHECPCVVAVLGDTPGFMWEVTALVRASALARTVFVFPPVPWPQRAHRLTLLHRALIDSVPPGATPVMPPNPPGVIALVVDAQYRVSTIAVDRWDEAGYRAALRAAFAHLRA